MRASWPPAPATNGSRRGRRTASGSPIRQTPRRRTSRQPGRSLRSRSRVARPAPERRGARAAQIWVVNPLGSERHQLTDVDGGAAAAVWSPDGKSLAYSSEHGGQSDIFVAGTDGSNPVRLTEDLADDWAPSWSPDGRSVLFTSDRTGDNDIWEVGIDGTGLTRLTDDGADDDVAVVAPDGSRIAFVSTRSGDAEVWTMARDGSDPTNLTQRPAADDGRWSVAWAPDGQLACLCQRRARAGQRRSRS